MPQPFEIAPKDGSKRWRVRFRDGQANASETFVTQKQARDFCKMVDSVGGARARAIINENERDEVGTHTLGEVADLWLEWKSATRKDGTPLRVSAPYTLTRYEQIIRLQIKRYLGNKPVNLIDENDVQKWVDTLAETLSPKTCAEAHSLLSAIYRWAGAKKRGLTIVNPTSDTQMPHKGRKDVRGLNADEWKILYAAAREVDSAAADLLLFMVGSGWRWSEAVALRAMDVDDHGDHGLYVSMGRSLRRHGNQFEYAENEAKSQAANRRIKMPDDVANMIQRRKKNLAFDDLLFTNPQGRKWIYAGFHSRFWSYGTLSTDGPKTKKRILQVAEQNGLSRAPEVTLHWLRHTHAALMLIGGESMAAVQKRLGHEDIRTTVGTYGSLVSDVSDEGLSKLNTVLGGE